MTARPRLPSSRASSSASVVLPAAGGPSTATRSGCEVGTDSIASASRSRSSPRVPLSMACALTVSWYRGSRWESLSGRGPEAGGDAIQQAVQAELEALVAGLRRVRVDLLGH